MTAPDEFIVQYGDRAMLWLHNWGIERKRVVMIVGYAIFIAASAAYVTNGNFWAPPLIFIGSSGIVWMETNRLKGVSPQNFNAVQAYVRTTPISWAAFTLSLLNAVFAIKSLLLDHDLMWIDAPIWIVWFIVMRTFLPTEPPKRHWREVFTSHKLASDPL